MIRYWIFYGINFKMCKFNIDLNAYECEMNN